MGLEVVFWTYAFTSDLRTCQVVLGLVGLWWCFAALWVEVKIEHTYPGFDYENPTDPEMKDYKPFCDFAPWATCSKVLMSPPGRFLRYFGIAKQGRWQRNHQHGARMDRCSKSFSRRAFLWLPSVLQRAGGICLHPPTP